MYSLLKKNADRPSEWHPFYTENKVNTFHSHLYIQLTILLTLYQDILVLEFTPAVVGKFVSA